MASEALEFWIFFFASVEVLVSYSSSPPKLIHPINIQCKLYLIFTGQYWKLDA
jgi:hypothetical protein